MKVLLIGWAFCFIGTTATRSLRREKTTLHGLSGSSFCKGPSCARAKDDKIMERNCSANTDVQTVPTEYTEAIPSMSSYWYTEWIHAKSGRYSNSIPDCSALCSATIGCNFYGGQYFQGTSEGFSTNWDYERATSCTLYNSVTKTVAAPPGKTFFYGSCNNQGKEPSGGTYNKIEPEPATANIEWATDDNGCTWTVGDSVQGFVKGSYERIVPAVGTPQDFFLSEAECAELCDKTDGCAAYYGYKRGEAMCPEGMEAHVFHDLQYCYKNFSSGSIAPGMICSLGDTFHNENWGTEQNGGSVNGVSVAPPCSVSNMDRANAWDGVAPGSCFLLKNGTMNLTPNHNLDSKGEQRQEYVGKCDRTHRSRRGFNMCHDGMKAYNNGADCCRWEGIPFDFASATCPSGQTRPCPFTTCEDQNFITVSHIVNGKHFYQDTKCYPKSLDWNLSFKFKTDIDNLCSREGGCDTVQECSRVCTKFYAATSKAHVSYSFQICFCTFLVI